MQLINLIYLSLFLILALVAIYEYWLIQNLKNDLKTIETSRNIIYETIEKMSKTDNEDEIYAITLDAAVSIIQNATTGSILLAGEDGNFRYKVVKGFQKELENVIFRREEAYLYKLNKFKETAIISNPREFDRINTDKETIEELDKVNALDIFCTISAPIYIDNKFIGLLNVDSDKKGSIFTEKDVKLMNQIKCELEIAIKNALAQNRLKYLADFDELTGIMNRRSIKKEYDHELEKIRLDGRSFCFVMIDMDNFKCFNDTYGHYFGDVVLKHFVGLLINLVKKPDIVGRFSGDEFIIILKDCNLNMAETKMSSITKAVSAAKFEEVFLEFSYGICEVGAPGDMKFDKALALADQKMYEHKKRRLCKRISIPETEDLVITTDKSN